MNCKDSISGFMRLGLVVVGTERLAICCKGAATIGG